MRRNEYGLIVLQAEDGLFLKGIQCEWILFGGYCVRVDFERFVFEIVGQGHLVTASVETFQLVYGDAWQFFTFSISFFIFARQN